MIATLEPRPGFNWSLVNWGGPDEIRTDRCSYCGDLFPDDDDDDAFIPLILYREAGWAAEFCDHCQATWFGVETFPEPPDEPDPDVPDLGPCCICETSVGVHNIIMLDRRGVIPGHGWGCVGCGLPPDGAYAVLCDPCLHRYHQDNAALTIACRGYPATEGRIAISELPAAPFEHDDAKHGGPLPA